MTPADNIVITKLRYGCQKSLLTSDKHFRLRTIQVSYNSIICNSVEHWFSVTIWRKLLQNRTECLSKLTASMLLVNHSALSSLKNSEVAILTWGTKNVNQKDMIYYELLKPSKTVNTERYRQQIIDLNQALREKRPEYKKMATQSNFASW